MTHETDLSGFSTIGRTVLSHQRLWVVLAVTAIVLSLPTLKMGWEPTDDLRHRVKLLSPSRLPERLFQTGLVPRNSGRLATVLRDMHTAARTPEDVRMLKDYGTAPWWMSDKWRYSNWRPLDSLTHWLDYRLYPDSSVMIHAHSILWFAAVVVAVTGLYRTLIAPAWAAGLAALLYVLDENNLVPVLWIANRNVLIALVFGILALLAHHRWRSMHSPPAAVAAVLCLPCSLLATEAGIAVFAYLFAYAVFLDRGPWRGRLLSLLPYIAMIVSWRVLYNVPGHGVYEVGGFADPVRQPLLYARYVIERVPLLFMGQWGWPSDINLIMSNSAKTCLWVVSVLCTTWIIVILVPLLRQDRGSRFWLLGSGLAILPICATAPMGRNLLFVAIGGFALIARLLAFVGSREEASLQSRRWRIAAGATCVILLLVHIPGAVTARLATPVTARWIHQEVVLPAMDIGSGPELANQNVIIVNSPMSLMLLFIPSFRAHYDEPLPETVRQLASALTSLEVERIDTRTLRLRTLQGNMLTRSGPRRPFSIIGLHEAASNLFLPQGLHFKIGQTLALSGLTIEVTAVDHRGLPSETIFHFPVALEDASLRWLQWDWGLRAYKSFVVPDVGETCVVPGPTPDQDRWLFWLDRRTL